ncbi:serine/threonine protein kinase [Roseiconus lacunae]|uniref:serine/threonine protein kinase n=1 Tax=Roseiconus lacunae TaxID=2605694 RepID=UPI001E615206|nr:serine/threonine-protein kinase [Roseiconus lacunae]MCD0462131.1 serine/threonine protein kinase [Roseiconus lacunae]
MENLEIACLSVESQQRIDEICRIYETEIRSSRMGDPLVMLNRVPEQEAPVLLFELLRIHAEIESPARVFDHIRQQRPDLAWIVERVVTTLRPEPLLLDETVDHGTSGYELVGTVEGHEYLFRCSVPGKYIVGRSAEVDWTIPDTRLSERSACFILEPNRCLVVTIEHQPNTSTLKEYSYQSSFSIGPVQFHFRRTSQLTWSESTTLEEKTTANHPIDIDGFEITRELGRGGFGVVYDSIQLGTQKRFAIKSLLPDAAGSDRLQTLFMREISIISQLKHPNIVGYHGFGIVGDHPYLILEYVENRKIDDILDQHPDHKKLRLCIGITRKILAALAHAHAQGVVHRDVKLSNVLTGVENRRLFVKLTDFGLSKFFETAGYSGITASETVCGTIAYMSPEQLTNSKYAEPDCDVYSTAVCLYRMLTGRFPHDSDSPAEIVRQKMNFMPTPIDEIDTTLPAELSALLQRALHQDPQRRLETAEEFARELEPFGL